MSFTIEHRLRAIQSETVKVEGWLKDFAERAGMPERVRNSFDLALEEWITNVNSYAYETPGEHWIVLRFSAAEGLARVEVEDRGREFDPLKMPPADITQPLETRSLGGLGIHMIRQLMDEVRYRREDGRNTLTLTKRFAGQSG
jgi:anti-sigma regulatory factor (Ser/Thr protein kinase)